MADQRQHREHGLNEDAVVPLSAPTLFEVGRLPLGGMEGGITQDNHALVALSNQPLKRLILDIGRGTVPCDHQAILVQHQTKFAPDNPAMIGEALAAELRRTAAFTSRMDQLDAIRVDAP